MSDDWGAGPRLEKALRTLEGLLLSREPRQHRAYRQRYVVDNSGSDADIERARRLIHWLLDTLTTSTKPERWRQLAAMLDTARLAQPAHEHAIDSTAPMIVAVDITLPAATELRPSISDAPTTESMAGTFVGDQDALAASERVDHATESARRAPGGTLHAGKSPDSLLDIEKYAVLCAWTEVHPERRAALHAKYGVESEEARAALDRAFDARFAREPDVRAAFAQRLKLHLKWLRQG
jgi:hypothetical protein